MAERAPERMTPDEFLRWAEGREGRWEFVDGEPVGMAGAQARHDQVVINAIASLRPQLRGSACRPFTGDTAVQVPAGNIRRPDVGVDCGRFDPDSLQAGQPTMVLEVLSPSNTQLDILQKLEEYRGLQDLEYCILVDPTTAQVMVYSRTEARAWISRAYRDLADVIEMPAIGAVLALAELYEDVPLASRPHLVTQPLVT